MDLKRPKPLNRMDTNIKPQGFKIPGIDMEKLQERLQLPDQFLNTCTLREGSVVVIITIQVITVMFVTCLVVLIVWFPEWTEAWWQRKFKHDFDFYIMDENLEFIDKLWPLWRPFTYALIGVESTYFVTGIMVAYALSKKTIHPAMYLPWLTLTALLLLVCFGTAGVMIIVTLALTKYRDISVTWDVVPICLTIAYGCGWFYGFTIVVSHYRRRCIVKYWRENQSMMGMTNDGY